MALVISQDLIATQLWPQGDIRDPLGVWGARVAATGVAGGDEIKVFIDIPIAQAGAFVFTCYSAIIAQLSGTINTNTMCRLLSNWPNIDPAAGVQGYSTNFSGGLNGPFTTAPTGGPSVVRYIGPNDRFILLFDPRSRPVKTTIVELKIATQIDTAGYSFEAYGYYWDRSVLQAPGGPRHPGSS